MKRILTLWLLASISPLLIAAEIPPQMLLDKVVFQLSAKQWVTTQTALLTVNINAALSDGGLVKARDDIMSQLGKIASGDWHLTRFDRSQDSSGLDKLFVEAQVRVPQASLTDIYQRAKKVSKPGATYTINTVEFKPSLDETQAVKTQLRQRLYQSVNEELTRLNKAYNDQHYSVNRLFITEGEAPMPMQPRAYKAQTMNTLALGAAPSADLSVSNELTMTAWVEAASNREGSNLVAKASH